MNEEVDVTTNRSLSIIELLKSFANESLSLLFNSLDRDTLEIAICAILTIIGASTYMYYKIIDKKVKHHNDSGVIKKEKILSKYGKNVARSSFYNKSKQDNFDYHKILSELHNVCDNCSNVFSSMKCIQLTSDYPELINVRLYSDGITPFHRVCSQGNDILMEFMLAKGADPELKTAAGENALCKVFYCYLFKESKNFKCLDILYRRGCYFNCNDQWYDVFLKLAVKYNKKRLIEWLISHSKSQSPNAFNRASSNPL